MCLFFFNTKEKSQIDVTANQKKAASYVHAVAVHCRHIQLEYCYKFMWINLCLFLSCKFCFLLIFILQVATQRLREAIDSAYC